MFDMKKSVVLFLFIFLLSINLASISSVDAASSTVTVTTKVKEYKGQNYTELYGGNPTATKIINKVLKEHAVQNSTWSKENKASNGGYNYTSSKVVYNANEKISLIVTDVVNVGGTSKTSYDFGYNFDLKTGKQIKLNNAVSSDNQKENLNKAVSSALKTQYSNGNLTNSPKSTKIDLSTTEFYYYADGIVLIFNSFAVDNFKPFIVKIPYKTLNSSVTVSTPIDVKNNPPKFSLDKDSKITLENGKIPGFGDIKFGDTKAEISRILGSSPKPKPELGGNVYSFPNVDSIFFIFDGTDSLFSVTIFLNTSSNTEYSYIQNMLGKGSVTLKDDPDDANPTSALKYKFGKSHVYFYSDLFKDKAEFLSIQYY